MTADMSFAGIAVNAGTNGVEVKISACPTSRTGDLLLHKTASAILKKLELWQSAGA